MNKIKIIGIAITIFAIISGIGLKVCSSHNKDNQAINENNSIAENEKTEIENQETPIIAEIPVEENIADGNIQNNDIMTKVEDNTEKPKENSMISNKTDSSKSTTSKQDVKSSQTITKTETPVTTPKESKIEQKQENTIKTDSKKAETKTETKQEEIQTKAEWCFEGGSKHIAGDGKNEHGYYNTWEDAFNAYEKYTKDWLSSHYKINQCACGKYYFWAIQD